MLLKRRFLDGIRSGQIDRAFRRWKRPTVTKGGKLHTAIGVLAIGDVEKIAKSAITERDARRAGYPTRKELLDDLRPGPEPIYRIMLKRAGDDPRIALRRDTEIDDTEFAAIERKLKRLDIARRRGPWTRRVLNLIADRPATRAGDLAESLGRERLAFKTDVRKLKALGLTESLDVGYRLSPRGRAVLRRLNRR